MTLHKIQSIYTVVHNMDALQVFYSQLLGAPPAFRDGDRWTQFKVGHVNFALSSAAEAAPGASSAPGASGASCSIIVFQADGLQGVRETVIAAGGHFVAERDMGAHGTVLSFTDPEGHPFQVFAKNPPTQQAPASQGKGQP